MRSAWEAIFLLLVLKIPMVYLGLVVWWAVRAEPTAGDDGDPAGVLAPLNPCDWDDWKRRRSFQRLPRPVRPVGPHARRLAAAARVRAEA